MHDQYSELLNDYLDGQLDSLEMLLVEEHIVSCAACRRELNQLKLLDWELKHQVEIELPAELEACRIAAVNSYLDAIETDNDRSRVKVFLDLQVNIINNTSRFISLNPFSRTLNKSVRSSVTVLGKAAGAALKKKKPGWSRLIPGQV